MNLVQAAGLSYYQFEHFGSGVTQGIFTRNGGISPAQWGSLNLGGTNGDARAHVVENRKRIFEVMGRPVETIFDVWQVHGTRVICASEARPLDSPHQEADAILTDRSEITLFMRFADCVPIFLYEPVKHVIGVVHAGWKGTLNEVAGVAVRCMQENYGVDVRNILAGIGPSICANHYEVGPEVEAQTRAVFANDSNQILKYPQGRPHLDLWMANRVILEACGVEPEHIEVAGICTAENLGDWYSHRGEHGKTGRFGALLALK
jgi:polyphenol oxidase